MRALPFQIENDAFAELAVANALAEAHAARRRLFFDIPAARARIDGPRNLNARPHFLEELVRNLLDEARRRAVAVDAVQAALLGVRHVQLLHRARGADVAQPALFFE